MSNKAFVFIFAALFCVIQITRGDDISDLIKELIPKIQEALVRVSNVTTDGRRQAKDTFVDIQQTLNDYEQELSSERKHLMKVVYQDITDAIESGKNISNCVHNVIEAVESLVGWQLEACRISEELNDLTLTLATLEKKKITLIASPVKCTVSSGGDIDKLKTCVLDIISEANKQCDNVEAKVTKNVATAVEIARQCGSDQAAELSQSINNVNNDFNDCVSKV